ncbi:polysaccharide biosynthesis tyrosine autokinase [Kaistella sp. DKR-2]|uniref:GumC family protein n=1 Tax=Kaistella soli TaxID=2849654 RepID=UPI001C253428|nr:tyrosine-protein kinase family protein [Kaistella soli]MBU8883095.1 polysaccharide biosynthesis tyrosine autokinase [Kaistella soli]
MEFTDTIAEKRDGGQIKRQIQRYFLFWPLFSGSLLLALFGAWLYLRYATPQYMSKASLYVKSASAKSGEIMGLQDFQNMALPSGLMSNEVDNEISVVKSKPLILSVVKSLGLEVKVINEGNVKEAELYETSPVKGSILSLVNPRAFSSYSYTIFPLGADQFKLKDSHKEISGTYGVPVKTPFGSFVLNRNPGVTFSKSLTLSIVNPRVVADKIEASLNVVVPQKKSSIMELSRIGTNPIRSEDILNELMKQYNIDAIKDKNAEALNTASFIDERLNLITRELGGIESQKENFKEANKIADLQAQAQLSLQNASENTKKMMEVGTQLEMVDSVLKIANSSANDQLLPTNVGMPAGLDNVINEYNQLVLTRNRTLRQATPSNPAVQQFNRDIASMRELIRDNLRKSRTSLQISMGQIQNQINKSGADITKFPQQERVFRSIERQQNLKEALFLYLLQKREETSIALSVNTPKAKIVNPAYTVAVPVAPKGNIVYLAAALLGLLLPGAFLYTRFALDTYVHSRRQIREALPEIPVVGEIPNAGDQENALVRTNDFSSFAEAFRIMLTNIKFVLTPPPVGSAGVILVSSSVKGEGKTTISVNTALSIAQTRKVLLVGADIRNPQFKRFMDLSSKGLSDYLASGDERISQYIEPSGLSKNLDVIPSGSIAPNPTELLAGRRFETMLQELKPQYDYIVIDTAPMLMVSDTFNLLPYMDLLLYVMRAEHTDKDMFEFADRIHRENAKGKFAVVLNDVRSIHLSYGNKYGYGYYTEEPKKKKWFNFFS